MKRVTNFIIFTLSPKQAFTMKNLLRAASYHVNQLDENEAIAGKAKSNPTRRRLASWIKDAQKFEQMIDDASPANKEIKQ